MDELYQHVMVDSNSKQSRSPKAATNKVLLNQIALHTETDKSAEESPYGKQDLSPLDAENNSQGGMPNVYNSGKMISTHTGIEGNEASKYHALWVKSTEDFGGSTSS
jgi:hypothetical protein